MPQAVTLFVGPNLFGLRGIAFQNDLIVNDIHKFCRCAAHTIMKNADRAFEDVR